MKITHTSHLVNTYNDLYSRARGNNVSRPHSGGGHKFDALTVQANSREIEEKTFAESVSRDLFSEIKQIASEERLHSLKEQITSHSYQIEPSAIASRILLFRGEEE